MGFAALDEVGAVLGETAEGVVGVYLALVLERRVVAGGGLGRVRGGEEVEPLAFAAFEVLKIHVSQD